MVKLVRPKPNTNPTENINTRITPMPAFESLTLSLPAHWIAPVLFGDLSPLDEAEAVAFSRWLEDTKEDVGHGKMPMIGWVNDQAYFARYHDAAEYGVLACDCYDVELLVEA